MKNEEVSSKGAFVKTILLMWEILEKMVDPHKNYVHDFS